MKNGHITFLLNSITISHDQKWSANQNNIDFTSTLLSFKINIVIILRTHLHKNLISFNSTLN